MKAVPVPVSVALLLYLIAATSTLAATHYVNLNNQSPASPYTNWPAAATNIQDAIDASSSGDLIVVSNGVYKTGSRTAIDSTPCRVVINKGVTVRSLNGPGGTAIEGFSLPGSFPWSLNSVRCAFMTNGATLIGFTLTNGSVRATSYRNLADPAGGVLCAPNDYSEIVSNCVIRECASYIGGGAQGGTFFHCLITNCIAHIGGGGVFAANLDRCQVIWGTSDQYAGGVYYCNATNCTINDNLGYYGGGAFGGTINQCTVFGNYAPFDPASGGGYGGGVNSVEGRNSIVYYNVADSGGNDIGSGNYTNCCTSALPAGSANITNAPLFIDMNNFPGNFHLQTNSPCINAGNNAFVSGSADLDGRLRVVGPKADMGAFEFQGTATDNYLRWLWGWHLPTDVSIDSADSDGDGMNNWQEWRGGTNPTNASSALKMLSAKRNAPGIAVSWQSVSNVTYYMQRGSNLVSSSVF